MVKLNSLPQCVPKIDNARDFIPVHSRRNVMKVLTVSLLACSVWTVPVLADAFTVNSAIDAVMVYPQGADVSRVANVTLPAGEHQLVLENLPGSIDPQSIRVAGEAGDGVEIASVDSRALPLQSVDLDMQRKALQDQIDQLTDQRTALDSVIADIDVQRQFLMSLATKQLTPTSTETTAVAVDAGALNGLLDVMQQRLAGLAKATQEARSTQKGIERKISDLELKMSTLAPQAEYRSTVTVNLAASQNTLASFRVSYRVQEAGWQPYYDARLTTPVAGKAAGIELVRRAEVVQSTTEDWSNVKLSLSTARPGGQTQAPDIFEEQLAIAGEFDSLARTKARMSSGSEASAALQEAKMDVAQAPAQPEPVSPAKPSSAFTQRQAFVSVAGFQAIYEIAGRVSVDNSGTSKKVRISTEQAEAKLAGITVPRLDANAYLTATFVVGGSGPLMPGAVNLYRDGVYVGQGGLPLLNASEEAKLGFGVDDQVKVQRAEVKRRTGEEGLLTSSNVEERAWDISVKNLHDFTLPITVMDRIPYSTRDDVVVSELGGLTAVTERDVEKKKGVVAWRFELESKSEKAIKTGYKISWPKDVQIGAIE
jgi:uncharacterized protein (TIGR02231 family)